MDMAFLCGCKDRKYFQRVVMPNEYASLAARSEKIFRTLISHHLELKIPFGRQEHTSLKYHSSTYKSRIHADPSRSNIIFSLRSY